jgi:hypothetical protein
MSLSLVRKSLSASWVDGFDFEASKFCHYLLRIKKQRSMAAFEEADLPVLIE